MTPAPAKRRATYADVLAAENRDRGPKRRIYAEAGIGHPWLVDPRSKFIEAFGLVDGHWLLLGTTSGTDRAEVRLPPFDAISFPLSALWPLDPPTAETQDA